MTTAIAKVPMVAVSAADYRALRVPWSGLLRNKAHEFLTKARGSRIKGQGMIGADAGTVRQGFASLTGEDFREYNLPQEWVESRQIPQVLNGRVPATGAFVLDLGCGPGTSTRIICHFADPSWTILGYDLTPSSIAAARDLEACSAFRSRTAKVIHPEFECQDISKPLLWKGVPLEDGVADIAVSGGVVGLYMHEPAVERLLAELHRIIRSGGFAALDAGPSVPASELRRLAAKAGFIYESAAKSFVIEPRPKLTFRRP